MEGIPDGASADPQKITITSGGVISYFFTADNETALVPTLTSGVDLFFCEHPSSTRPLCSPTPLFTS
jgi:hypothetical protein